MKKTIIFIGAFVLFFTAILMATFSSYEKDLQLAALGLSWEKDSEEIMKRMKKVSEGSKAKALKTISFPIGQYAINKNGGVLPLWGALGQSSLLGVIIVFFYGLFFRKDT